MRIALIVSTSLMTVAAACFLAAIAAASASEAPSPSPVGPAPLPVTIPAQDPPPLTIPPVEQVGPGRYRMGEVEVNKKEKSVSFPAEVNMERGMLEYLLVRDGGKTHESLLRTRVEPINLQLACLLLGMEGTTAPLPFQGAPQTPLGERVEIALRLADGKTVSSAKWLTHASEGQRKDVTDLQWVYTGSLVRNGRFGAQVTRSMIAIYHDPVAIIDNATAGGEMNGSWFVKEGSTPPVGTAVTVIIRSLKGS